MLNPTKFIMLALLIFAACNPAYSKTINFKEPPFAAVGDGVSDDRQALMKAFSAPMPGDTLMILPGNYRIILTKDPLKVPAGVTLWGQSGKSRLILSSDGGPRDHREFLRLNSDVVLDGLVVERAADFPAVLLPVFGDINNVELRNCSIIGGTTRLPNAYCHAIQVGVGTVKNLALREVLIKECTYGLFQSNDATGTLDGVCIERSRFERNAASDLEFNSPKGQMRNVAVRDCFFRDNLCKSAAAGFAVGFANVSNGTVENCDIRNYSSEALHVEDRSANIHLVGNTIVGGSTGQPNGVVMVLSGSKSVVIDHNFIDARPNKNNPHLILVTGGGARFANPSEVTVTHNVLVNGLLTKAWYLQPGCGPFPADNHVIAAK